MTVPTKANEGKLDMTVRMQMEESCRKTCEMIFGSCQEVPERACCATGGEYIAGPICWLQQPVVESCVIPRSPRVIFLYSHSGQHCHRRVQLTNFSVLITAVT